MQIQDAFIRNNELTSHVAFEPTLYKTLNFAYGIIQKRRSAALTHRLTRAFIFLLPTKLQIRNAKTVAVLPGLFLTLSVTRKIHNILALRNR